MRHGLLLIDKPASCTSHDVVRVVRRCVGQKKVGHCGTLDPDATGLLVLTLGWSTRLTRFLIRAPKVYVGTIRFGTATDTYDASGRTTLEGPTDGLRRERIHTTMAEFVGTYSQMPPPYCAKKIGGVRYYELARRGEEVPQDKKDIKIYEFDETTDLAGDAIDFRLSCASGTYARSLAHELGQRLGCPAHLSALRRLMVGNLDIEKACGLEELKAAGSDLETLPAWIPFDDIPLPFDEIRADTMQERRITHGQTVLVDRPGIEEGDWVRVVNGEHHMVAVGTVIERVGSRGVSVVQPRIVFK
mgnify:CR=1 FL=1|jgi:tRNA pseudouridine55 synthase